MRRQRHAIVMMLGAGLLLASTATTFGQPWPIPQPELIDFKGLCIKTEGAIVSPKLGNIGGKPAAASKLAANTFNYAIVEAEILDFDPVFPPEIRIFDDTQGTAVQPLETIEFAPYTKTPCPPLKTLRVPLFLAYDPDPWSRAKKEPEARITRIELHHGTLSQPFTAYAKLKEGIFVVPVYWHNVAEAGGKSYVNPLHVMELFWTAPTGLHHNDVNSIWAQADVQFRLVNTSIPFHVSSIPTHVIDSSEHSSASKCQVGWNQNYNNNKGVDLYTIYDLSNGNPTGIGNCRAQRYVLIKAHNPNTSAVSGLTDPLWNAEGRAILVAHEFGHYLAALPHKNTWNNLMHSMLGEWVLDQSQIDLARQRIKDFGTYNESK